MNEKSEPRQLMFSYEMKDRQEIRRYNKERNREQALDHSVAYYDLHGSYGELTPFGLQGMIIIIIITIIRITIIKYICHLLRFHRKS